MRGDFMRCDLASLSAAQKAIPPQVVARLFSVAIRSLGLAAIGLTAANCSAPKTIASSKQRTVDPKYGVMASPRVVGENDPVPKGGGREMVGKPYVIAGRTYVPRENPKGYVREGLASWYGTAFHGRLTANGEIFDRYSVAAAHPTLPLPSYARVTNLQNKRSIIVRVNDRGPYHGNRLIDVSQQVAEALEFKRVGTSRVRVEYVGRASINGSDDNKLLATLRTDGRSAPLPSRSSIMVADAGDGPLLGGGVTSIPLAREESASRDGEPDATAMPSLAASQPRTVVRTALAATLVDNEEPSITERVAADVPLPPERPLDFAPIRTASTPVPATSSLITPQFAGATPPRRPADAGGAPPIRVAKAIR